MQGVSAGLLCACGACSRLTSVLTKYLIKQSKFLPAMTGPFLYWLGKSFDSDSSPTPNVYGKLIPAHIKLGCNIRHVVLCIVICSKCAAVWEGCVWSCVSSC